MQAHVGWAVDVERHDVRLKHKLESDRQARDGCIAQLGRNQQNLRNELIKVQVDDVDGGLSKSNIEMARLYNMHCNGYKINAMTRKKGCASAPVVMTTSAQR